MRSQFPAVDQPHTQNLPADAEDRRHHRRFSRRQCTLSGIQAGGGRNQNAGISFSSRGISQHGRNADSTVTTASGSLVLLQNWRSTQPEPFIPYGILYPNIVRTAQHPVFTLQEAPRDTGVIGGILTNSREHGIETAKTAARILKGEKPADIPIQTTKQHPVFDWNSLAQWDIPAGQLPPDTVYLNKPSSFWENWKQESVITGAIALLLLIWYLVLGEQRRRNQKKTERIVLGAPIPCRSCRCKRENSLSSGRQPDFHRTASRKTYRSARRTSPRGRETGQGHIPDR